MIADLGRLLVLALLAVTWLPAAAQVRIPATVTRVVDGDTLWVQIDDGTPVLVRLIGIDAPETKHPSKPIQCFGGEAWTRTAGLVPHGARVELERDVQVRDRYGRMLAYVWREGSMPILNEQLVAEGYALTLTMPPNVKYAERFANAERVARKTGLGFWSACAGQPLEATDEAPVLEDPAEYYPLSAP
jgi:micrococcal nuclease